MNLFWNTINLTIAGFALYSNLTSDYGLLSGNKLLEMQAKSQRIFLINGALDVGYIATGFIRVELGFETTTLLAFTHQLANTACITIHDLLYCSF